MSNERFLVHLSTDKPIYKLGDTVYIRAVAVNALNQSPAVQNNDIWIGEPKLKILAPSGDVHKTISLQSNDLKNGSLPIQWNVTKDVSGGDYTLKLECDGKGFTGGERTINIREFQNPRLNSQLEFVKKAYSPGEKALATLKVVRAEGGIPVGAQVEAIARIDGREVYRGEVKLNDQGKTLIRFDVPEDIEEGDGNLVCVIHDGGVVETESKTIPLVLQKVDVDVYPEGGDLVAGVPCGLYIEARLPSAEPADITANIVHINSHETVGTIQTVHEGRGKAVFTPQDEGCSYELRITKPQGVRVPVPLPEVKSHGVSLRVDGDIFDAYQPIQFHVASTEAPQTLQVELSKKDQQLGCIRMKAKKPHQECSGAMTVPNSTTADGVLRLTVSKKDNRGKWIPMAERLVFRLPAQKLNVKVLPDRKKYTPADEVKLSIQVTDEDNQPVPKSVVGLTVTDETVLEMQEDRKKPPLLDAMLLLEDEVSELKDSRVYLSDQTKAPKAVDLLLGTQGWRRFVFASQNKNEFREKHGDKAKRVLAPYEGRERPAPEPKHMFFGRGGGAMPRLAAMARGPVKKRKKAKAGGVPQPMLQDEDAFAPAPQLMALNAAPPPPPGALPEGAPPPPMGGAPPPPPPMGGAPPPPPAPRAAAAAAPPPPPPAQSPAPEPKPAPKPALSRKEEAKPAAKKARLLKKKKIPPPTPPAPVNGVHFEREYAHRARSERSVGSRVDFTETVYWNCGIETDDKGRASVRFALSESVTSFRVFADAISNDGVLGVQDRLVSSVEPFYLEPKLPIEVTSKDQIHVPISLVNESPEDLQVDLALETSDQDSLCVSSDAKQKLDLETEERKRVMAKIDVGSQPTACNVTISGEAGPLADSVQRSIRVAPEGFPFNFSASGKLGDQSQTVSVEHEFEIPENYMPGSMDTQVLLYPAPKGRLMQALKALLRMPFGCFEQTSATLYPVIMVQQYIQSHSDPDLDVVAKANDILQKGYKKLLGYECKDGGFEWFGRGPGHEALSAYGLAEFVDMAKVYPVEDKLLERTRSWILSRRSKKGGFLRNPKALDSFGRAPEHTTDAYIVFSLVEAGLSDMIQDELNTQLERAKSEHKDDAYFVGLTSASLLGSNRREEGMNLAKQLAELQAEDGSVQRSKSSVTSSRGKNLHIETTSICCLAWMATDSDAYAMHVERAMNWILKQCQNGRFGSTQATILALRAIIKHDASSKKAIDGKYEIHLDNQLVSEKTLTGNESDVIDFPSFASQLKPGTHSLRIEAPTDVNIPYSVSIDYYCALPDSQPDCQVDISTQLLNEELQEGEGTEIAVEVTNKTQEGQGMTLAIIGLPGGAEPRHEKLKELVNGDVIDYYEVEGREVILYWRQMAPQETKKLNLDIIARVPGIYTAPASRAYLYYADDLKTWIAGSKMKIN